MYYLLVFVVLLGLELLYFRVADYFNIIDKPNERSSHTKITLRGGGVVFYMGALIYVVATGFTYPWFMIGLTLIAGVSFMDDVRSVSPKVRLVIHFMAILLMFYQWGMSMLPWWYMVVALIVCAGIINAYNFMDGINGITGGYSLVVLGALFYVNERVVPFVEDEMICTMIIAVFVFNIFNFRRKAKCFAGDVGSVSMAFIVLFLLGRLILITGDWSYIIFLAVYGVDCVLTIIHRLMLHENIGFPHRKHVYQLMANELGMTHLHVSALYMAVQGTIVAIYLALPELHHLCLMVSLVLLGCGYIAFMRKYFKLHSRY